MILIHTKREARDDRHAGGRYDLDRILIHTKREARDDKLAPRLLRLKILIHTKREARDDEHCVCYVNVIDFNPHEARSS